MRARTKSGLAAMLVACGVLTASAAHAAPLSVGVHIRVSLVGTTLKVSDASKGSPLNGDFDNQIAVKVKRDEGMAYVQDSSGDAIAGPGCEEGPFEENVSAGRPEDLWAAGWGPWQVRCPFDARLRKVSISAGPGYDIAYVLLSHVPVHISGGADGDDLEYFSLDGDQSPPPYWSSSIISGGLGDDYLVGGRGSDKITGDRGYDWVEGTCGADYLDGGNDDDQIIAAEELWGNMDCPAAPDIINCGSGADGADVDATDVTKNCESVAGPF